MSEFDRFADSLADEVLGEMAETFFGSRREMDEEVEHFHKIVRELKKLQEQVESYAEILHFLLLDEEGVSAFYAALGLDPAGLPFCLTCSRPPRLEALPFAFTPRGRYRRLLEDAYAALRDSVEDCLHGHEYADPDEPRRRRVSVHREAVERMERRLNAQIEKLNRESAPSDALQYMHRLDPSRRERENIVGVSSFGPESHLDADFRYPRLDMAAEGIKAFPELPSLGAARPAIRAFAAAFCARRGAAVRALLAELRAGVRER